MADTANLKYLAYENPFALPDDPLTHDLPPIVKIKDGLYKSRWYHIEDLDTFFYRIYKYHQNHGFLCMILEEFLESLQFVFLICLSFFMIQCIDYSNILSNLFTQPLSSPKFSSNNTYPNHAAIIPFVRCAQHYRNSPSKNLFWLLCLWLAFLFLCLRICRLIRHAIQYWDIRSFYHDVLEISSNDLPFVSWQTVVARLKHIHRTKFKLSVQKAELTDLDILHRLLRFQNFFTAMIGGFNTHDTNDTNHEMRKNMKKDDLDSHNNVYENKGSLIQQKQHDANNEEITLLPLTIRLPIIGWEVCVLNYGLSYNLHYILFRGPFCPFRTNWQLREEYKTLSKRIILAERLRKRIVLLALVNALLSPIVFVWQLIYYFFAYAQAVKNDPSSALGSRIWSPYAMAYFRHYNEPDHELKARLARAYPYATRFVASFGSRLTIIIARFIAFVSGSLVVTAILVSGLLAISENQKNNINVTSHKNELNSYQYAIAKQPNLLAMHKNQSHPSENYLVINSVEKESTIIGYHNSASVLFTVITVLGIVYGACRALSGSYTEDGIESLEQVPLCRKALLKKILANVHYLPAGWFLPITLKKNTHIEDWDSEEIRDQFCTRFFELKLTHFLVETFGPIINPWILYRNIAPKALEIVDFFREYTIELDGVGDICSLANLTSENESIKSSYSVSADTRKANKNTMLSSREESYLQNLYNYDEDLFASKLLHHQSQQNGQGLDLSVKRNFSSQKHPQNLPKRQSFEETFNNLAELEQPDDTDIEEIFGDNFTHSGENIKSGKQPLFEMKPMENLGLNSDFLNEHSPAIFEFNDHDIPNASTSLENYELTDDDNNNCNKGLVDQNTRLESSTVFNFNTILQTLPMSPRIMSPVIPKTQLSLLNYLSIHKGHNGLENSVCTRKFEPHALISPTSPKRYNVAGETLMNTKSMLIHSPMSTMMMEMGSTKQKRRKILQSLVYPTTTATALPLFESFYPQDESVLQNDSKTTNISTHGSTNIIYNANNVINGASDSELMESLYTMSTMGQGYAAIAQEVKNNQQNILLRKSYHPSIVDNTIPENDFAEDLFQKSTNILRSEMDRSKLILPNYDSTNDISTYIPNGTNKFVPRSVVDMSLTVLYLYNKYQKNIGVKSMLRENAISALEKDDRNQNDLICRERPIPLTAKIGDLITKSVSRILEHKNHLNSSNVNKSYYHYPNNSSNTHPLRNILHEQSKRRPSKFTKVFLSKSIRNFSDIQSSNLNSSLPTSMNYKTMDKEPTLNFENANNTDNNFDSNSTHTILLDNAILEDPCETPENIPLLMQSFYPKN